MKEHLQTKDWGLGLNGHVIIAGPCSAETPEQVEKVCLDMIQENAVPAIFRAGIWKPRTRPGSFEGIGEDGLKWMEIVRHHLNIPITTEVGNTAHVELALKYGVEVRSLADKELAGSEQKLSKNKFEIYGTKENI